jgi:hypothetical protein
MQLNRITAGLFESTATFRKNTGAKMAYVTLGLVDLVLTVMAANLGLTEINPFMSLLIQIPLLLLAVKLLIPGLLAWLMPGKFLIPSIALLAFVVAWDIKELAVLAFIPSRF